MSGPYLTYAENINWNWLVEGSSSAAASSSDRDNKRNKGEELVVLITKWGDEIIGALAMRVSKRDRRAYIKAWTVKLRFRCKDIGRGLLEEASKIALAEKGCRGLEFEEEHASEFSRPLYLLDSTKESKGGRTILMLIMMLDYHRVLPKFFNATFDKREAKARERLAEVVAEQKKKK